MSDDPSPKDPPPGGRPADHLPYGVDTIVIPFTWSDRQEVPVSGDPLSMDLPPEGRSAGHLPYGVDTIRLRISWPAAPASRGYNGRMWRMRPLRGWTGAARQDAPGADEGTGDRDGLAVTGPGHAPTFPEQGQVVPANQAVEGGGPASELLAAFRALRAGALQGRGPTAKEADAGLSGGSGADGGWGSSASNTEGFGATAPDQATAMLASSPLSGASPPTDAGTAATADAGAADARAAKGAAAAGVGKPNDPTAPVPVFDDQGRPVLIPKGPYEGQQMLRPARLDPHFFVNQGTADRSYYDALTNNAVSDNGGADLAILSLELMQLYKLKQGGVWDAQRAGGKNYPEYVDYATVAIGLYAASSGVSRDEILRMQDAYAARYSRYSPGTDMDKTYTHLPVRNVANTDLGFQLTSPAASTPRPDPEWGGSGQRLGPHGAAAGAWRSAWAPCCLRRLPPYGP